MDDISEKEGNPIGKSLIQKAIRRGDTKMTEKAFYYLVETDHFDWLRRRLPVIIFEECWPFALNATFDKKESLILTQCLNLSRAVKNKNAAGLGELVYEYSNGNNSIIHWCSNGDLIRQLADDLKNADQFWMEMKSKDMSFQEKSFIFQAESAFKKAYWPYDKAFAIAGAYLATEEGVPEVEYSIEEVQEKFPLWAAIDKHTPKGKEILISAAREIGLDSYKALQLSFYFEGAKCNEIRNSLWWDENVRLQIRKIGYNSLMEAEAAWNQLKPIVIQKLQADVRQLEKELQRALDDRNNRESDEPSLF